MKSVLTIIAVLGLMSTSQQFLKKQNATIEEREMIDSPMTDDNNGVQSNQNVNNQPIIGILTQPSSWPKIYNETEYSYIASSYVKFAESGGA